MEIELTPEKKKAILIKVFSQYPEIPCIFYVDGILQSNEKELHME